METPHKVLYGKDANLSHLKIPGARAFVHIKDATKLGHTFWEGMVCGFSKKESNSYHVWNPRVRYVVEAGNVVFLKIPPYPIPQPSQLFPLQGLQSSSLDFIEDTLDDNCVSREEMFRDVRDYTAALDFNTDISMDSGNLHNSESPREGVSPSGKATPQKLVPLFHPRHHWHPRQRPRQYSHQRLPTTGGTKSSDWTH